MSTALNIKVAISTDFMESFANLPEKIQKKASKFLREFRQNPASSGINYEKIQSARDPNFRSVRIDQDYRGIILKPESGDLYMLLWVARHDDAYDWARSRVATINAATGSLQVYTVDEVQAPVSTPAAPAKKPAPAAPALFAAISDAELLQLGIPELLLPLVRRIQNEAELDASERQVPPDAAEALYLLAAGYSVEESLKQLEKAPPSSPVDTSDFVAALDNPDSQRRFCLVTDDKALEAMLDAPLDQWRIFLHPSQRRLVDKLDFKGPVLVLGGAGTGKTVVAMHRARRLAEKAFPHADDRILFTTFTKNLAEDIRDNLKKLCPADVMKRIEVINLDGWIANYLRQQKWDYDLVFNDSQSSAYWEAALLKKPAELPEAFFKDEWQAVIQAQNIRTEEEYLKAPRLGRGRRISRVDRKKIWPVFQEYRSQLDRAGKKEFIDATRDAMDFLTQKPGSAKYRAIIVDEAQDMNAHAFSLLRKMVPEGANDIFIVGDAHQRIYGHKFSLSSCGVNIRGRSRKHLINYRTTEKIRRWAVALLEGRKIDDLDGNMDDHRGYRSLVKGLPPEIQHFPNLDREVEFLAHRIKTFVAAGGDLRNACLVARTKHSRDQYGKALKAAGIDTLVIASNSSDKSGVPGLRLATMHRVKGLEFDIVFIAGVNDGAIPLSARDIDPEDEYALEEGETRERSLLYVAATRAKREVVITSSGKASKWI